MIDLPGTDYYLPLDFWYYWVTTRLLLLGYDPYNRELYTALATQYHIPFFFMFQFNYCPAFFPLIIPFAILPPFLALYSWVIVYILVSYITYLTTLKLYISFVGCDCKEYNIPWHLLFCYFLFPPFLDDLSSTNAGFIITFFLVLFFIFRNKRPFLSGSCLGLCLFKPHLLAPALIYIVLGELLLFKRRSLLVGILFSVTLFTTFSSILRPSIVSDFLGNASDIIQQSSNLRTGSLNSLLVSFLDLQTSTLSKFLVFLLGLAISILMYIYRSSNSTYDILVLITIGIFCAPHSYIHAYLLAAPLWLFFVIKLTKNSQLSSSYLIYIFSLLFFLLYARHGSADAIYPFYSFLVFISLVLAYIFLTRKNILNHILFNETD